MTERLIRLELILCIIMLSLSYSCMPVLVRTSIEVNLGDTCSNANYHNDAILHYSKALNISENSGIFRNFTEESELLRKLAYSYSTQGQYKDALLVLQKALALDTSVLNNKLLVIKDYKSLGKIYMYAGNYSEALKYFRKSVVANRNLGKTKIDNIRSLGDCYLSIGQINSLMGDFAVSDKNSDTALIYFNKINDEEGALESYLVKSNINIQFSDFDEATKNIEKAKDLAIKNKLNLGRQFLQLSDIQIAKGLYQDALQYRFKALEEAEHFHNIPQIIGVYISIGDMYKKIGDLKNANEYYEKARKIKVTSNVQDIGMINPTNKGFDKLSGTSDFFSSGSNYNTAIVLMRLGEIYLNQNFTDSASVFLSKSNEIFTTSSSNEGMVNTGLMLCRISLIQNDLVKANSHLNSISKLKLTLDSKWQMSYMKARIFDIQNQSDSAISSYKNAIAIIEQIRGSMTIEAFKNSFIEDKIKVYDDLILLLAKNNQAEQALEVCERARSRTFLDMIGNRKVGAKNAKDSSLIASEQALKLQIQQLGKEIQKSDNLQLISKLNIAQVEYQKVLSDINTSGSAYSSLFNSNPVELLKIKEILPDSTGILEYWLSKNDLVIWLISKNKTLVKTIPVNKNLLKEDILFCIKNIQDIKYEKVINRKLNDLSEKLILPFQSEINQFNTLNIVPNSILHILPFQLMKSGDNEYLVQKFNIFYNPSLSVWYYCRNRKVNQDVSLLGMALGNISVEGAAPLKGTDFEIEHISQLYQKKSIRKEYETTKNYFKQNATKFDILHLATHGFMNQYQPMNSYLLFAPEKTENKQLPTENTHLTVEDIFKMNINSQLITLSACQTGLGDISEGDEMVGLSRAFIFAGTSTVIVSLWNVNDASTTLLMTRFYQYCSDGIVADKAMAMAQREIANNKFQFQLPANDRSMNVNWNSEMQQYDVKQANKPAFWAPFIIIGDGNILLKNINN